MVIVYCLKDDNAEEVRSCARYFSVQAPQKADSKGLIQSLGDALKTLGIDDILDKDKVLGVDGQAILVGGGTDGAAVNISEQNGVKGTMQRALPWLFWAWCYAHHLELACKDSLSSQLFKDLTDMLLRLYYLYEKSPKKTRELLDIISDLKQVFDLPYSGGYLPIRSQGSRWITHKRKALQRVIDRYGAYLLHLNTLAEDRSIKSDDRARIRGYAQKWGQSKMLIGCALYVDILKPPSLLSLTLQDHKVDIVLSIKHILKTSKSLRALAGQDPLQWPTIKLVQSRLKDENGKKEYQGATLQGYSTRTLESCRDQAMDDLKRLDESMRDRLEWSDVKMLRSILVFLDTQGWQVKVSPVTSDDDDELEAGDDGYLKSNLLLNS